MWICWHPFLKDFLIRFLGDFLRSNPNTPNTRRELVEGRDCFARNLRKIKKKKMLRKIFLSRLRREIFQIFTNQTKFYSVEWHLRIDRRENIFSIGWRSWLLRKKSIWKSKIKNSAKNLCWQNRCGFVDIHFLRIFSFDF